MNSFIISTLVVLFGLNLAASPSNLPKVLEQWGGKGVNLLVLEGHQAILSFDCARGNVEEGRWPVNQSRINAAGTYTKQTGLRPPPGYVPRSLKANYAANIDYLNQKMTLSVKVGKQKAMIYRLVKDQESDLKRCM